MEGGMDGYKWMEGIIEGGNTEMNRNANCRLIRDFFFLPADLSGSFLLAHISVLASTKKKKKTITLL